MAHQAFVGDEWYWPISIPRSRASRGPTTHHSTVPFNGSGSRMTCPTWVTGQPTAAGRPIRISPVPLAAPVEQIGIERTHHGHVGQEQRGADLARLAHAASRLPRHDAPMMVVLSISMATALRLTHRGRCKEHLKSFYSVWGACTRSIKLNQTRRVCNRRVYMDKYEQWRGSGLQSFTSNVNINVHFERSVAPEESKHDCD